MDLYKHEPTTTIIVGIDSGCEPDTLTGVTVIGDGGLHVNIAGVIFVFFDGNMARNVMSSLCAEILRVTPTEHTPITGQLSLFDQDAVGVSE